MRFLGAQNVPKIDSMGFPPDLTGRADSLAGFRGKALWLKGRKRDRRRESLGIGSERGTCSIGSGGIDYRPLHIRLPISH